MSLPEDRQAKAPAPSRENEEEKGPIGKRTKKKKKSWCTRAYRTMVELPRALRGLFESSALEGGPCDDLMYLVWV